MTLNGRELLTAQVIWDHDHGTANEGWYLRTKWSDGQVEDDVVPEIQNAPVTASDSDLRSAATMWLHNPDGMTDQDREDLRDMIEVKR